jgi:hypothetical protein
MIDAIMKLHASPDKKHLLTVSKKPNYTDQQRLEEINQEEVDRLRSQIKKLRKRISGRSTPEREIIRA